MSARDTLDRIKRDIADRKAMRAKRLESKREFKEALEKAKERGRVARLEAELAKSKSERMILEGRANIVKEINKENTKIAERKAVLEKHKKPSLLKSAFLVGKKINQSIDDFDRSVNKSSMKKPRMKF